MLVGLQEAADESLTRVQDLTEFEKKVAAYVGTKHAIAFTSNSTGMETALRALEIGEGDEIIVPAYTHPITAGVVMIVGATPILVDVDYKTGNIDYEEIIYGENLPYF